MSGQFRFALALFLTVSLTRIARAQPAESPDGAKEDAKPGDCHYLATGVKECYPVDYIGKFTIKVYRGVHSIIQLPEPAIHVIWPPDELFDTPKARKHKAVVPLLCLSNNIDPSISTIIRTKHYSLTFDFEVVGSAKEADSQLHVVPFDQRGQDAQCQRRIDVERDALAVSFAPRVKRGVSKQLLRGLRDHDSGNLEGKPHRNDHIILTPRRWVRIHDLYIEVEVSNQDRLMHLAKLRLEVQRGKKRTGLSSDSLCGRMRLAPHQHTRCWLSVPRPLAADERLRVVVSSTDGRSVTSEKLHAR